MEEKKLNERDESLENEDVIKNENEIDKKDEKNDEIKNKSKLKIVVILGIILAVLITIAIIRKNNTNDEQSKTEPVEEVALDYYYDPEDSFLAVKDAGEFKTDTVIFKDTIELLEQKGFTNGIIINTMDEFINYANLCTECGYACGVGIPVSEEYFETGSLVVYMHSKDTSVAGMKISEIDITKESLNLYLAVSEGDAEKVTDGKNAEILYLFSEKINSNANLEISTVTYGVELKSKEAEEKIDPNVEIEIPVDDGNMEYSE